MSLRASDERLPLRAPAEHKLFALEHGDLDGDGARKFVLTWRKRGATREPLFDLLRFGAR